MRFLWSLPRSFKPSQEIGSVAGRRFVHNCAFVGVISVLFYAQVTLAQTGPVERPALNVGSEWSYAVDNSKRERPTPPSTIKRTIKEVKAAEYSVELVTPQGTRIGAMSLDLNPFSEGMTAGSARSSAPLPYFQFPLAPGKTYSGTLTYPTPLGQTANVEMTTKVLEWENVTVPAGTFKALKIEAIGKSTGQGINGRRNATLWYSPDVGHYVRMEFDLGYGFPGLQIQELTSYALK